MTWSSAELVIPWIVLHVLRPRMLQYQTTSAGSLQPTCMTQLFNLMQKMYNNISEMKGSFNLNAFGNRLVFYMQVLFYIRQCFRLHIWAITGLLRILLSCQVHLIANSDLISAPNKTGFISNLIAIPLNITLWQVRLIEYLVCICIRKKIYI